LQDAVDCNIQQIGFLPGANGNRNGHSAPVSQADKWACSDKQKDLVLKIVDENKLDKAEVEKLSQDRFGKGVKALNKLEASSLIEELLEQTGQGKKGSQFQKAGGRWLPSLNQPKSIGLKNCKSPSLHPG